MSSKSVIVLGLLASLLLIFLCIFFNAERYYKELGLSRQSHSVSPKTASIAIPIENSIVKNGEVSSLATALEEESNDSILETKEEDRVAVISSVMKEENSSFNYYTKNDKTFISGKLPLLENGDTFKVFIANCSKNKSCENNVTFFDNGETLSWKGLVSSVLTLFDKEDIANPKLSIDKKNIKIEGLFAEQQGKDQLLTLLDMHKETYTISDMTTVVVNEPKKEERDKPVDSKHQVLSKEKATLEPAKSNLEIAQKRISALLKNNKINFKKNSGKIRREGKKVLDKVVLALAGKKDILIEVQGHTDAGGSAKINLRISQMRANGVKKYLIKKGLKADTITAKGFGERQLLLPKTPYNPSNRRVEIYLKRK